MLRKINDRFYWCLFFVTWIILVLIIRSHVVNLSREVRFEGYSNHIVLLCHNLLIDHIDIETGLRGYLISAQPSHLRPYHEGLGRCQRDMTDLENVLRLFPEDLVPFGSVKNDSKNILKEFSNQVAILDSMGTKEAQSRFLTYPTSPDMDRIRFHLNIIMTNEGNRLADSIAASERSVAIVTILTDLFMWISVILLLAMGTGFLQVPQPQPRPPVGGSEHGGQ
jgi:CHASE3 domain sensor protein